MIPSFSTDSFAVFDDFLVPEHLEAVRQYLADERFTHLRNVWKPNHYYRLVEGDPLVGPTVYYNHPKVPSGFSSYPCGKSSDFVVESLIKAVDSLTPWVGSRGSTWDFLSCTPYLYPVEAGLAWHDDAKDRSGSFVLYLHDEWKSSWGAELLIASDVGGRKATVRRYQGVDTDLGHYVAAVPNRLVVIKAGTPHRLKSVSVNAGENLRISMTGFFQPLPLPPHPKEAG
jgi:hypothetical protein